MSYKSYELLNAYSAFCAFGSSKGGSSGDGLNNTDTMTNSAFAKLCKDTAILDKTITTTEVDIVFNKFKPKGGRKLDFHSFNVCLRYIAQKKFGGDEEVAYKRVVDLICKKSSGPILNATLPDATGVFDKLTDSSLYTGASKNRFDEDGNGKGIAGRKDLPCPKQVTSDETLHNKSQRASIDRRTSKGSDGSVEKLTKSVDKLAVFDRLTNTSNYTGASKARFDSEGNGKGLAGRDSISKSGNAGTYRGGDVRDLSQILRS